MRDPPGQNSRWNDNEYKAAINLALSEWQGRVQVPHLYAFSIVSGTFEYTLPDYIDTTNLDVQAKHTVWGLNTTSDADWRLIYSEIPGWRIEPDGSGGQSLIVDQPLSSTNGRVIWYGYNGQLPSESLSLNADIDADDTSLVLSTQVWDMPRVGYVLIDNEWISYAGTSDDGSNLTLENLVRGINNTTAATHTASTAIEVGIAAPSSNLWQQLYNQVAFYLHTMYLTDGSPRSTETHERVIGLHKAQVDMFWRQWVPIRSAKFRLTRQAMTEMPN